MASTTDEPHPHTLAIRQDVHVITQTLSWQHTTFTTHVTLGGPATASAEAEATTRPTTTAIPTEHHSGAGGLTDAQIGAIAGSIVGVFILVFVVLCCCCQRRPPPARHGDRRSYASYTSSTYIVDDAPEQPPPPPPRWYWPRTPRTPRAPSVVRPSPVQSQWPPPVAERIPGGPKFPTYRAIPIPNPRRPNVVHLH
jgi:hypothetical protein